jgi:hypothetical protein
MRRAGFAVLLLGIESAQDGTLRSMGKGFTTGLAREHFRVLRRSGMLLVGYFIVGNVGETEAEMLEIAPFARELGVDVQVLSTLRNEPYSGMDELIARTPGYHSAPDGLRHVYSDRYPVAHLRRLQRRLYRRFYTPGQVLRTVKKSLRTGIVTPGMVARLPAFLLGEAVRGRGGRRAPRPAG